MHNEYLMMVVEREKRSGKRELGQLWESGASRAAAL